MQSVRNFIDGDLCPARFGREFDVWEPALGQILTAAAWRDTPAADRARYLNRLADLPDS